MPDAIILNAEPRTITGRKVKQLRRDKKVPAVLYGHGKNENLTLDASEFAHVLAVAGTSSLVDLKIGSNKPVKILLHEPQIDPVKGALLHGDLYAVKMTEKLETEIPLQFIGTADAVEVLGGTLNMPLDALWVECYPDKLVPAIEVDISSLKTFDDVIRLEDITLPDGIEAQHEPDDVLVSVTPPRSEEEMAELEAPTGEEAEKAAVEGVEVSTEKPEGETAEK